MKRALSLAAVAVLVLGAGVVGLFWGRVQVNEPVESASDIEEILEDSAEAFVRGYRDPEYTIRPVPFLLFEQRLLGATASDREFEAALEALLLEYPAAVLDVPIEDFGGARERVTLSVSWAPWDEADLFARITVVLGDKEVRIDSRPAIRSECHDGEPRQIRGLPGCMRSIGPAGHAIEWSWWEAGVEFTVRADVGVEELLLSRVLEGASVVGRRSSFPFASWEPLPEPMPSPDPTTGTIRMDDDCVYLDEQGSGVRHLLVFPAPLSFWDAQVSEVVVKLKALRDGSPVSLGGVGVDSPPAAVDASVPPMVRLVQPWSPSCVADRLLFVHRVSWPW